MSPLANHRHRRHQPTILVAALLVLAGLTACTSERTPPAPAAVEFTEADVCELTGLRPFDHIGPKGQIHFRDRAAPVFYCDTVEMLHVYLTESEQGRVLAIHVQDAGQTDWFEPRGHWIDARNAIYVAESSRIGPLGATLASFNDEAAARAFRDEFGGRILRFPDITQDDVALDGGALHDTRM